MKTTYITSLLVTFLVLLNFTVKAQNATMYLSSASGSYSVIEGNVFSFNVNLYSANTTATTVTLTTADGTAGSSDYSPLSTSVTIPAGQLSSSVVLTITTVNDSTIESNEDLIITGTVTSGNTTNATATLSLLLIDNDTVPTVTTTSYNNSLSVNESNFATVHYYLSNPYSSNVVIHFTTTPGTASTSDFTAVNTTVSIPAGQTQVDQYISINNDSVTESDESFTLTGSITSGNTTNSALTITITIIDNDTMPAISFSYPTTSTTEGQSAYNYIQLNRSYNSNIVVQYNTVSGTSGTSDYTATSTTATIFSGDTSATVAIPTTQDSLDEPEETFTITGTVTSGNTTNTSISSVVTIVDNDGLPDFHVYNANYAPFLEEGQNAPIGIMLTHPSTLDTIVQLTTISGTAGSLDYTALTTSVTIPAGQSYYSQQLLVPTILDQLQEGNETFNVQGMVTSGNTYNTSDSVVLTIADNYAINAQGDSVTAIAEVGTTYPLFTNDTLHGLPLNASDAAITLLGTNTIGATVTSQGIITIPANTPIGQYYGLSYQICESANPTSCDTTPITIEVKSPIEATYNLTYTDYNGDGFTSVGDLINYQFTITNHGNAPLTSIQVDQSFGNITVLGGPITSLNPGQVDNTTFTATHILTQDDINFGSFQYTPNQGLEISFKGTYYGYTVNDWTEQQNPFSLNTSDGIRLNAFVDTNSNGIQDNAEINFPLGHFNYEINNNGFIHNLYTTPYYLYESNPTTTYNLSYQVNSEYAGNSSCAVAYTNVAVSTGSGITTYNFPIIVTPYQDLSVNLMSYLPAARPGFLYSQYINYTNNSNQTVASGTVSFTKDSALSINSIYPAGATTTPTGFTYAFTNLLPYETRFIGVEMQVPTLPTVALGQLITNTAAITIPAGDISPLNNSSALTQTIVGSYDPNTKTESHGAQILSAGFTTNDYLTYTIRFENTGTANAINVVVDDILDSKLEPSSIKMIYASAAYSLERINNQLQWKFNAIDLPPSIPNDDITGHGYIVFQVKPKAGYAVGDIIPNTASIYFDFNPAIVTNTCTTEFVNSLNNETSQFANFYYYPNPVSKNLFLSNSCTIDEIELSTVLGQVVLTKKINDLHTDINMQDFGVGIYFVKILSNGKEKKIKIIKD